MAAAPPHSWPFASAAILCSMEMALAGPSSPPPPCQPPPPPCSPSFPHSPAPRPSAPRVPLAAAAAQPPFFLKGRVEGGFGVRPRERRLCRPIDAQTGGPGPAAPPFDVLLIGPGRRGRSPRGVLLGREQRPGVASRALGSWGARPGLECGVHRDPAGGRAASPCLERVEDE